MSEEVRTLQREGRTEMKEVIKERGERREQFR